ncbi:MAG: hypothetical protein SGCHY_000356 [Lobulomycetales sp.]
MSLPPPQSPEQALLPSISSALTDTPALLLDIAMSEQGVSLDLDLDRFNDLLDTVSRFAASLQADATLVHRRSTLEFGSVNQQKEKQEQEAARKLKKTKSRSAVSTTQDTVNRVPNTPSAGPFYYGHVLVRRRIIKVQDIPESRVAVVGNVDAGKSTLLGCLTRDVLDDGRGKARVNLFRHKHEIESGRTSSVGTDIMGFDSHGRIVSAKLLGKQKIGWEEICSNASKVITFFDLAGHEKYLRTTVFGMTGHTPDYVILMVGANAGMIGMTKEHLGLSLAMNVPVMIVVTKIDMCPPNILEATLNQLTRILRSSGCRKIPIFINNVEDVLIATSSFVSERICPIFQVSNVTGENLDLLKMFLNLLPGNGVQKYIGSDPVEYLITDTFSVPGVGTVVNGTVTSGVVHSGDTLLLGPDFTGAFTPTTIKSIQRKRINVPVASAGQTATFALKKTKRGTLRKGMVLLSRQDTPPLAVYEFEAEILILFHSSTIKGRYQTMMHCGSVRQTAQIMSIRDVPLLRTGDRAIVRFKFLQRPEYVKPGSRLLFREGRTRGVGKVVRVIPSGGGADEEVTGAGKPRAQHAVAAAAAAASGGNHILPRERKQ